MTLPDSLVEALRRIVMELGPYEFESDLDGGVWAALDAARELLESLEPERADPH